MKTVATTAFLLMTTAIPAFAELDGPLIDPAGLNALLGTDNLQIVDIRLAEGKDSYATGHVTGAVNAPYGLFRGPEDNPGRVPEIAELTQVVRSLGLSPDQSLVVTYQGSSITDFGAAARVYWTFKSLGFEDLAILNGGLEAWSEAGLQLSSEPVAPVASSIDVSWNAAWTATTEDVLTVLAGDTEARLVDARPEEFWKGNAAHPAAARPGTLPQSEYFVHSSWFNAGSAAIDGPAAADLARNAGLEGALVSFCNTGHWAATNWFAMSELAGLDAKLYPESMVGWSNAGHDMANVPGPARYLWNQIKSVF